MKPCFGESVRYSWFTDCCILIAIVQCSEVAEDAAGLPSQIRDVIVALSAALYEADLPHAKDAPVQYAFTDGLSNPASTSLLHSGDRKAHAEAEVNMVQTIG